MARKKNAQPKNVEPEEESQEVPEAEPEFARDEDDVEAELAEAQSPGKPMSKTAAAKAAIAEGHESPQEASAWIKREFGIDMAPQHFSAVKSQLKKKERAAEFAADEPPAKRGRKPAGDAIEESPRKAAGDESDLL